MTDDRLYLIHIIERVTRIEEFTSAGEEAFMADEKTQDAVIRNFEVIGEATKRVPAAIRELAPDVPWKMMAGFRDILIHNYDGVRLNRVWEAVQNDLPGLKPLLEALFQRLTEDTDAKS